MGTKAKTLLFFFFLPLPDFLYLINPNAIEYYKKLLESARIKINMEQDMTTSQYKPSCWHRILAILSYNLLGFHLQDAWVDKEVLHDTSFE